MSVGTPSPVDTAPAPVSVEGAEGATDWGARLPVYALAAVEIGAAVFWFVVGRVEWFYNDDWDFLATRRIGDVGDLFRPHNEHWVTALVVVYRVLYGAFGLHTYVPWRLIVLGAHLALVALLFVVMRRSGVQPWIAVAAASLLAFFGAGTPDVLVPVQLAFTGAFVLGLVQLLLADHEGPLDRRDRWGVAAGVVALTFSAFSVTMAVVVGVAMLLRRGWRVASFHTVPLAACYLVWFAATGHSGYDAGYSLGRVPRFVVTALYHSALGVGRVWPVVVVLAAVLLAGGIAVLRDAGVASVARTFAVPIGLAAGAVVFLLSTSTARSELGLGYAADRRYIYLVAALLLPTLAVAATAVARGRAWMVLGVVALLVAVIPANIRTAQHIEHARRPELAAARARVLGLPRDPYASTAPRALHPEPVRSLPLTMGWLVDQTARGRFPRPGALSPKERVEVRFRLSIDQDRGAAPTTVCRALSRPVALQLHAGDMLGLSGNTIQMSPLFIPPGVIDPPLLFFPRDGARLVVLHDMPRAMLVAPVRVQWNWRVSREDTHRPPVICLHRA